MARIDRDAFDPAPTVRSRRRRGRGCPGETAVASYLDGRIDSDGRRELEAHFADCEDCLSDVAILAGGSQPDLSHHVPAELMARARSLVPSADEKRRHRRSSWRWGAAAAAAALFLVWLGPWSATEHEDARRLRGDDAGEVSVFITSPMEGTVFPIHGEVGIAWTAPSDALFHDVVVTSLDGDLIWQGRSDGAETSLPADTIGLGSFYVSVRSHLRDGTTERSSSVEFEVSRGR